MPDRYVRMNILQSGGERVKANLEQLILLARKYDDMDPSLKIKADDTQAQRKLKDLKLGVDILNREKAQIEFRTKGDEAAKLKLKELHLQLLKINEALDKKKEFKIGDLEATEIKLLRIKRALDGVGDSLSKKNDAKGFLKGLTGRLPGSLGGLVGGAAGGAAAAGGEGAGTAGAAGAAGILGNPAVAAGGIIATLVALPFIAQAAAGGIIFSLGGAMAAIAIKYASDTKRIKKDWMSFTGDFSHLFKEASKPMVNTLDIIIKAFDRVIPSLSKSFGGAVKDFAGPLAQIGVTIARTLGDKAVSASIREVGVAFAKLLTALKPQIPGDINAIANGITSIAKAVARNPKAFADFIWFLAHLASSALMAIGWLTNVADYIEFHFIPAFKDIGHFFEHSWDIIWSHSIGALIRFQQHDSKIMGEIRHSIANVFDGIRHDVAHIWDMLWHDVEKSASESYHSVLNDLKSWWHNITNVFDNLRHDAAHIWDLLWHYVGTRAKQGWDYAVNGIKSAWHDIANAFDNLRHSVAHTWDVMWGDVKTITRDAVRGVGNAIHGIESAFHGPVAWVVDNVWDRLAGLWNKITGIVHLGSLKLPTVHMATGGVVPGSGTGDTVPAMLTPGERVLSLRQVAMMGGHAALDAMVGRGTGGPFAFAGGGTPGRGQGPGSVHVGVRGNPTGGPFSLSGILSWLMKPVDWIASHIFSGLTGLVGRLGSSGLDKVLATLSDDMIHAAIGALHQAGQQAFSSKYTGHYGAGVAQWRGDVLQALAMEHLGAWLAGRVLYQMQTESGGNPNAINLWDSNAAAGDPSRGLLQVIMTTFRAYHWPGTSWNIYNPLANIAAAINYARHRYGPTLMSGGMGMGSGHGYLNGGWVTEPVIGMGLRSGSRYTFAENGLPEYVSPAGRGGSHVEVYNVYVPQTATDPHAFARETVVAIRRYKRSKGMVSRIPAGQLGIA